MTLREKIETMEAFERGEEIEFRLRLTLGSWEIETAPIWDWDEFDYRIKPKPKQTVTIEKWLVTNGKRFDIIETSGIYMYLDEDYSWTKVKLLDTYEVEL